MTEERLVLADLLEKAGDGDFPRAVAEAVLQLLVVVRPHVFAGVFGEVAGKHHQSRFGSLLLRVLRRRSPIKFTPDAACARNSRAILLASASEMTAALPIVIGTWQPRMRVLTR